MREAGELAQWITDKESVALSSEVGDDLDQVEAVTRKFEDFQKVKLVVCYRRRKMILISNRT